jgi:hypothetical protein
MRGDRASLPISDDIGVNRLKHRGHTMYVLQHKLVALQPISVSTVVLCSTSRVSRTHTIPEYAVAAARSSYGLLHSCVRLSLIMYFGMVVGVS